MLQFATGEGGYFPIEDALSQETVCIDLLLPSHRCIKSVLLMETLTSLELLQTGTIKIFKSPAAVNVRFSCHCFWRAAAGGLISKQAERPWRLFVAVVAAQALSVSLGIEKAQERKIPYLL